MRVSLWSSESFKCVPYFFLSKINELKFLLSNEYISFFNILWFLTIAFLFRFCLLIFSKSITNFGHYELSFFLWKSIIQLADFCQKHNTRTFEQSWRSKRYNEREIEPIWWKQFSFRITNLNLVDWLFLDWRENLKCRWIELNILVEVYFLLVFECTHFLFRQLIFWILSSLSSSFEKSQIFQKSWIRPIKSSKSLIQE